ncbi:MAG: acetyl-CoA carboxylase biotin carboxyl carrier protein subunit, partial [Gemmatimonadota bacterium]
GSTGPQASEVRAPMPGLVVAVEVEEGARDEAGEGVVVIEAMKMENEIVAPASGIVRGVAVAAGDAVERNALVCRIEPDGGSPA